MKEQRTGLQKSVTAIFAGATMPEEARPICTHPVKKAEEAPPAPPVGPKRNKRKRVRQTLRLAYSKAAL